ncbi:MAG: hypothetical protein WAM53_12550, partial [Terrimicrobiaceae bacterium]
VQTRPELNFPAAGPASASNSHRQIPRSGEPNTTPEHTRTGLHHETLKAAFQDNLNYVIGRPLHLATPEQRYEALAQTVRDRIMQRWVKQMTSWNRPETRNVAYLSAGVPARPSSWQQFAQPRDYRDGTPGDGGARSGS